MEYIASIKIEQDDVNRIKNIISMIDPKYKKGELVNHIIAAVYMQSLKKDFLFKGFEKVETKLTDILEFAGDTLKFYYGNMKGADGQNLYKSIENLRKRKEKVEEELSSKVVPKKGDISIKRERAREKLLIINQNIVDKQKEIAEKEFIMEVVLKYIGKKGEIRIYLNVLKSPSKELEENLISPLAQKMRKDWKNASKIKEISEDKLFESLFDILYLNRLTQLNGQEAKAMKKIWSNAIKVFPRFKEAPFTEKKSLMRKGLNLFKKYYHKEKSDIYRFAKCVTEQFLRKGIADEVIYKFPYMMDTPRNLKLSKVYFKDPDCGLRIDNVKFLAYTHQALASSDVTIKDNLKPFDLWIFLTKGHYNADDQQENVKDG